MLLEIKLIYPKKSTKMVRAHRVLAKEFPDLELYAHILPSTNTFVTRRYTISLKSGAAIKHSLDLHYSVSCVRETIKEHGIEAIKQQDIASIKKWNEMEE
jgi:hypothetical protein